MRSCVLGVVLMLGILFPAGARAEISGVHVRAFMLTSTYGVLAGTLTGIATLAFYDDPSDNLKNVAVGASLGLYTGIILGMYLVYFNRPGDKKKSGGGAPEVGPESDDGNPLNLEGRYEPDTEWAPIVAVQPGGGLQLGVALNF